MRTVKVSTFTVDSCIPELNFWFKMEVLKYRNSVLRINQIQNNPNGVNMEARTQILI